MAESTDLKNLYTALRLEIQAVERYEEHQSRTDDPKVFALLQGLMRNEVGHEEHLIEHINRLGGDPEVGKNLPPPALPNYDWDGETVKGQKTNMAMLRADFTFEEEATKTYHAFAAETVDDEVKALFIEFARAEKGHVNGLRVMIKEFTDGSHVVAFYCPVCGWEVSFRSSPESGAESRCKMCGILFGLKESDGDFVLERQS